MPIKELSKHIVLYAYDGCAFTSMGVLSDGNLRTNLSEVVNVEEVSNDSLSDLSEVKVTLRMSLLSRIKLMWVLRRSRKKIREHGYLKRIYSSFKTFYEGLKYQIKHRKK